MHIFNCEECGTKIMKTMAGRYMTTCEHYPISKSQKRAQQPVQFTKKPMTRHVIDKTGQTIGALTVLEYYGTSNHGCAAWVCLCSCGVTIVRTSEYFSDVIMPSCGCKASVDGARSANNKRLRDEAEMREEESNLFSY